MWLFFSGEHFFWHTTLKRAQVLFGGRRGYTLIRNPTLFVWDPFGAFQRASWMLSGSTIFHVLNHEYHLHTHNCRTECMPCPWKVHFRWILFPEHYNCSRMLKRDHLVATPHSFDVAKKNMFFRCSHFVFHVTKDRSRGNATRLTLFFTRVGMVPFVRFPNTPTRGNGENGETG